METTLSIEIKQRYEQLPESAQTLLSACAILCTDGEVNIRHLCDIIDNGSQCFRHELDKLLNCGLLIENFNRVQVHNEVIAVLSNKKLSVEVLNSIIENLTKSTTPSFNDDLLQVKDYFTMGMNILKFVVQEKPSQINYEYFANLAVNLTQLYEVFAVPDLLVNDVKDLPLMQGIELALSKTNDKSMLYVALITSQAYVLLNGFHYEVSRHLLDKAINISQSDNELLAYSLHVYALWWENYGCFGNALSFSYRAWQAADQCFRNYIASYVAYILALCDEYKTCKDWMERVKVNKFGVSAVGIYFQLACALYNKHNDLLSLKHLRQAEEFINQTNFRSPLKARFLFVKSVILDDGFNMLRESNICYREYAELITQLYLGTNGAMYIYLAREASRLISIGATTSAKQMINKLDSLQFHPGFALSVRICAALAYSEYFRGACGSEFFTLADIYSQNGKELAERTRPIDEFYLLQVFGAKSVPPSLSGEEATYVWEYQLLQNMIENREVSTNEIKGRIVYLQKLYPNHKKELEVVSASLSDSYSAIKIWNGLIMSRTTGRKDKFELILQIARTAMSKDLIWDGHRYYDLLLRTDGYKDIVAFNKYKRVDILIEYAGCLELCGMRGKAKNVWWQLEILAEGTSKLADVYQLHGNNAFDHEQWEEALQCYNECLNVVQPEDTLYDERMTSILSFRSSCLGYLEHYQAAYDGIIEAKRYIPQDEFDSGIEFNHAYFALMVGKDDESRQIIAKAKNFLTDKEKESFDEILAISTDFGKLTKYNE
jgi:hypothetical protein